MLITELLIEWKEPKKPKGANKPAPQPNSSHNAQTPSVRVFFAKTFYPSFKDNVQQNQARSSVNEQLARFIRFKKQTPFVNFPGIDLHFDSANVFSKKNINHAKMALDHRLFYTVFRRDAKHDYPGLEPNVIYIVLFGIFTHDASGIGTKPNQNLQASLANSFAQAQTQVNTYREFTGQV